MDILEQLGFTHYIGRTNGGTDNENALIGRISTEFGNRYSIQTSGGEREGIATKTFITNLPVSQRPKVGDWIRFEEMPGDTRVKIVSILPRFGELARKRTGKRLEAQTIATNVDIVFIVESLTNEFDADRIERFLVVPETAGTRAALVLTKSDAVTEETREIFTQHASQRFPELPLIITSTQTPEGILGLEQFIHAGETIVLIGPSGVGKSSLINKLVGSDVLATQEVREKDQKGRHTTTVRQLLLLPKGGIIIDTPGMRELQLWGDSDTSLDVAFGDLESLIANCEFTDCDHKESRGCALVAAVAAETISKERYESFLKLKRELEHHATKVNYEAQLAKKKRQKKQHQDLRTIVRHQRGKRHH